MKRLFFSFLFLFVIFLLVTRYEEIIRHKTRLNVTAEYNKRKYNDIDVFFVGSSTINWTISPMYIWNKYGVASYNRGIEQQSIVESLNIVKDIFRKYKPKVIVLDIASSYRRSNNTNLSYASISNMIEFPYTFFAYKEYFDFIKYKDNITHTFNDVNTIYRFHGRWKYLSKYNFAYNDFTRGVWPIHYITPLKEPPSTSGIKEIDSYLLEMLKEIKALSDKHNCEILFIRIPYANNYETEYINYFKKYAKEKKWHFVSYNDIYKDINLNFSKDFQSGSHLNIYGSRKVMDHLIPYIIDNYNIPIRKHEPKYAFWDKDYIKYTRYENGVLLSGSSSLLEWQQYAFYDNYTILISTNGDNVLNRLPQDMKDKFKTLGLNKFETDKKNQKYVAIIDDGKVFFEEISDKKVEYKGRMKNKVNLLVSSENRKATINISGKPRAKNKYGINFVIYDKVNREIVDSIWIDPAKPNNIRR